MSETKERLAPLARGIEDSNEWRLSVDLGADTFILSFPDEHRAMAEVEATISRGYAIHDKSGDKTNSHRVVFPLQQIISFTIYKPNVIESKPAKRS